MRILISFLLIITSIISSPMYAIEEGDLINGEPAIIAIPCSEDSATSKGCYICTHQGAGNVTISCEVKEPYCTWKTCLERPIPITFAKPPREHIDCSSTLLNTRVKTKTVHNGGYERCRYQVSEFQQYKASVTNKAEYEKCTKKYNDMKEKLGLLFESEKYKEDNLTWDNYIAKSKALKESISKRELDLTAKNKLNMDYEEQIKKNNLEQANAQRRIDSLKKTVTILKQKQADNETAALIVRRLLQSREGKVKTINEAISILQNTIDSLSHRPESAEIIESLKGDIIFLESRKRTVETCTDQQEANVESMDYFGAWLCGDMKTAEDIKKQTNENIKEREIDVSKMVAKFTTLENSGKTLKNLYDENTKEIKKQSDQITNEEEKHFELTEFAIKHKNYENLAKSCYGDWHSCTKDKKITTEESLGCNPIKM